MRLLLATIFCFVCASLTYGQIALVGGANFCNVRNDNLIQNQRPISTFHWGLSVRYYPFQNVKNVSLVNELLFSRKGYQQNLDKNYKRTFDYFAVPVLIAYSPLKNISFQGGIELGALLFTNVNQGTKTYNSFDLGIVGGISAFDNKRLGIYSRITYGVLPMLDYVAFDELGNVVGSIHDLKNLCVSVGLRINIYNKQIRA